MPGLGYPWPWSVNRWIHGETAAMDRIADQCRFARDLAHFLNALQSIDTTGAPAPGEHRDVRAVRRERNLIFWTHRLQARLSPRTLLTKLSRPIRKRAQLETGLDIPKGDAVAAQRRE